MRVVTDLILHLHEYRLQEVMGVSLNCKLLGWMTKRML